MPAAVTWSKVKATPPQAEPGLWAGFVGRGLRNQFVCAGVALAIWLMSSSSRGSLLGTWVYSVAIGTACWFFIDGGRLLLARWLPARRNVPALRRARWPGPLWMAACILVGSTLGYTLGTAIGDAITGFSTPGLLQNSTALVISLIAGVAATWYFMATEKLNLAEAATETARREATESQLMLLQSQLEPHMLFNTLANLQALSALDPKRAQVMLGHLDGYLRATLATTRNDRGTLADEFALLRGYLEILAIRMGPRLAHELDLPQDLARASVPPMLLQPLVENAIKHGLEPKVDGGTIRVSARAEGRTLVLVVEDTGLGFGSVATAGSGIGLSNVRERLAALYGTAGLLETGENPGGGARVTLRLPLQT